MRKKGKWLLVVGLVLGGAVSCGGQQLDVSAYSAATRQLRDGAEESGRTGVRSLEELGRLDASLGNEQSFQESLRELRSAWKLRVDALDAVVAYTEELEQVLRSQQETRRRVEAIAESTEALLQRWGGGAASSVSSSMMLAGLTLQEHLRSVSTARSLGESLDRTRPLVREMVTLLRKDLEELRELLAFVYEAQRGALLIEWRVELQYRQRLLLERRRLYEQESWTEAELERLRMLSGQLTESLEWYNPLSEQLNAISSQERWGAQLLELLDEGLQRWQWAHEELSFSLLEEKPFFYSWERLQRTAQEVQRLAEKVSE